MGIEEKEPLFTNPLETAQGLSIDDLNKYLPALHKVEDLKMTADKMKDGLFLGTALNGIIKIPDNTIDLIKDNNAVTFEIEMGPKGPTATKVKLKV